MRIGLYCHAKGIFHEVVSIDKALDVDTMYVVQQDNLIVNITFAWEHAIAITTDRDAGKLVSHRFPTYAFRNGHCHNYYKFAILKKRFRYDLGVASPGGAGRNRVLNKKLFLEIPMIIPSYDEQQKIADFLSLVDERIEKQRQLVELLKRYKRGLLSLVFKGNFQMVKLADICDFVSSSHTISNLGARESGIYPVYDAAGLSMYIDTYDMHEEYISIVKDGSGIGRLQKCDKNSSFIGTLGALVAKNCEIDYLFAVLQTIDFSRFATGMAIPHIYYKDYKNTLIPLPSQDTQKNISRLFRNIDIHIEQNSIQLDKILVLKHGLLQQMFI